ncbi:hypothetical protein QX51_09205 [Terrisporobacter othiniensis]|uniref:Dihydrofolate reductase n=1 Tax=Terrisporobacter othiniensis TaxID=1577792 RepID=A0A0B3W4E5_9FIRM|nr:dihydrofolate reductase [Terrisporobacter othiniensis]KHS57272.1 hypothetical protein QX51_09205 [Terrisporobacter othiniensis]
MISLIVAATENNAIGKDNKMLFHIKEDLLFFKNTTINKTIVMGRKTFESLPGVLPFRKHIVLSRDKGYNVENQQVEINHSLEEVLEEIKFSKEEIFIIGGEEIYRQILEKNLADKIYITRIYKTVEDADTFFPKIDEEKFQIVDKKVLNKEAIVYVYENISK